MNYVNASLTSKKSQSSSWARLREVMKEFRARKLQQARFGQQQYLAELSERGGEYSGDSISRAAKYFVDLG